MKDVKIFEGTSAHSNLKYAGNNSRYSFMGYAKGAGATLRPFLHYVYTDNDTGDWYVRPIGDLGSRMEQIPHDVEGVYTTGSVLNIVGVNNTYSVFLTRDLPVKDYNDLVERMWAKHGPFAELYVARELVGRNYGKPVTQVHVMCNRG